MAAKKKKANKRKFKFEAKNINELKKHAQARAKKEIAVAKKKLIAAEKKIIASAKRNPRKALLIAAGIGAAVGAAVTSVLRRRKR